MVISTNSFLLCEAEYSCNNEGVFILEVRNPKTSKHMCLDATRTFNGVGAISRLINHSREKTANLKPHTVVVNGKLRVGFVASRDIGKYEELAFDYNLQSPQPEWSKTPPAKWQSLVSICTYVFYVLCMYIIMCGKAYVHMYFMYVYYNVIMQNPEFACDPEPPEQNPEPTCDPEPPEQNPEPACDPEPPEPMTVDRDVTDPKQSDDDGGRTSEDDSDINHVIII